MKKEYCGLVAIKNHSEAARMAYFGLYALQHRGQESAGIVTWDGIRHREHRGMGLVGDVFTERHLGKELKGSIALGHVRYSTTDVHLSRNAQPYLASFNGLNLAIAHNGNLINFLELRRELEAQGSIFQTLTDTEIFAHLIAKYYINHPIEEAIRMACSKGQGSFSLLILVNDRLIAVQDPHGFKPMALGRVGSGGYILASESCAFDLLEGEYIRALEPGEMLIIDNSGLSSSKIDPICKTRHCIFELVYFARPDSIVFDEDVYACRKRMGRTLALESPVEADYVIPFPDSGVYSAVGYAQASGQPFEAAIIRNHYIGRTFIQPTQDMRDASVRIKLNPVRSMIKGKRIVIVDDSIVRGTTAKTRVKELRKLGAKEIHMRVSCPPVRYPCHYGIDFSSQAELIAANMTVKEVANFIGLDSLSYLSEQGLLNTVSKPENYCMACLNGEYPVQPGQSGPGKLCLEDQYALSF